MSLSEKISNQYIIDNDYSDIENLIIRRNSDIEMLNAMESKKDELDKYQYRLIYNSKKFTNQAPNRILESHHSMTIENKILNFFIFAFTIFIILQFSLISIINFDITWPTLLKLSNNFEEFYQIAWIIILIAGKTLSYFCLLNFLIRCYIGIKIFKTSVNTNILLKLLNYQFMGYFKTTLITMVIIVIDFWMKNMLISMDYISDNYDHINRILKVMKTATYYIDIIVYTTLLVGMVVSCCWRLTRCVTGRKSVKL